MYALLCIRLTDPRFFRHAEDVNASKFDRQDEGAIPPRRMPDVITQSRVNLFDTRCFSSFLIITQTSVPTLIDRGSAIGAVAVQVAFGTF